MALVTVPRLVPGVVPVVAPVPPPVPPLPPRPVLPVLVLDVFAPVVLALTAELARARVAPAESWVVGSSPPRASPSTACARSTLAAATRRSLLWASASSTSASSAGSA